MPNVFLCRNPVTLRSPLFEWVTKQNHHHSTKEAPSFIHLITSKSTLRSLTQTHTYTHKFTQLYTWGPLMVSLLLTCID